MNEPIRLQFEIVLTPDTIERLAKLINSPKSPEQQLRDGSRRAIHAGEDFPEDDAILLNKNDVAKLLKVSDRTVFRWQTEGDMPRPIKIGGLVRWGRDELNAWVHEGCPRASKWKWPK